MLVGPAVQPIVNQKNTPRMENQQLANECRQGQPERSVNWQQTSLQSGNCQIASQGIPDQGVAGCRLRSNALPSVARRVRRWQ